MDSCNPQSIEDGAGGAIYWLDPFIFDILHSIEFRCSTQVAVITYLLALLYTGFRYATAFPI